MNYSELTSKDIIIKRTKLWAGCYDVVLVAPQGDYHLVRVNNPDRYVWKCTGMGYTIHGGTMTSVLLQAAQAFIDHLQTVEESKRRLAAA